MKHCISCLIYYVKTVTPFRHRFYNTVVLLQSQVFVERPYAPTGAFRDDGDDDESIIRRTNMTIKSWK